MQFKYFAALAVVAFAQDDSTPAPISSTIKSTRPGVCNAGGKECLQFNKNGNNYTCVSVEVAKSGLNNLAQCVKKADADGSNLCAGNKAGVCPTFNSWPQAYRTIEPICAFVPDPKCTTVLAMRSLQDGTATTTKRPGVECFGATMKAENGSDVVVKGFYKCMDKDLYLQKNYGMASTRKQVESCQGNSTGTFTPALCNSHGTCSPSNQYSADYKCKCNSGYESSDNCAKAVGNVCDGLGQCGALGQCNPEDGKCICEPGSKGNQCSQCDPAVPEKACSGPTRGSCGIDGKCQCVSGWGGPQCEVKSVVTAAPKTTASPEDVSPVASSVAAVGLSAAAVVIATLMA